MEPAEIVPDDKDWTVVITDGCADCGFSADLDPLTTAAVVRDSVAVWEQALARADVRTRPAPTTWSPLEYGCHVRDVCRLFRDRLELMLSEDSGRSGTARFANWDQDVTAVEQRYHEQDPATVAEQYAMAAEALAAAFDSVQGEQWQRRGLRSNGSQFTVTTFGAYLVHDLVHHEHDVN